MLKEVMVRGRSSSKVRGRSMTLQPRVILAVCIVGLICLSSLMGQIWLTVEHYKTSLPRLVFWTCIYVAIAWGLLKRKKAAYVSGIILSILQMVPLIISWVIPISKLFGFLPSWYVYSLYVSAAFGLALLITLLSGGSREFTRGPKQ
jgi:hypothetical protein